MLSASLYKSQLKVPLFHLQDRGCSVQIVAILLKALSRLAWHLRDNREDTLTPCVLCLHVLACLGLSPSYHSGVLSIHQFLEQPENFVCLSM